VSIACSGRVVTDLQRGTKYYLLSTECTDPDQELVWHHTGASLRAISSLPIGRALRGLRSAGATRC
jgi:hypothetical protein